MFPPRFPTASTEAPRPVSGIQMCRLRDPKRSSEAAKVILQSTVPGLHFHCIALIRQTLAADPPKNALFKMHLDTHGIIEDRVSHPPVPGLTSGFSRPHPSFLQIQKRLIHSPKQSFHRKPGLCPCIRPAAPRFRPPAPRMCPAHPLHVCPPVRLPRSGARPPSAIEVAHFYAARPLSS